MRLLDLVFPKKCINCKKFGDFLCPDCFSQIKYADLETKPIRDLERAISVVTYNNITRKLIRQFKYKPHILGLGETISEIMNEGLAQNEGFYRFVKKFAPTVIPVPLSSRRFRERGYNHAEILANYVAKYFHLKLDSKVLIRARNTKPQYKLNKVERFRNIRKAFSIRKNSDVPKSAVLVDDVATTFATLKEAAKTLNQNGSERILGVTFAREI